MFLSFILNWKHANIILPLLQPFHRRDPSATSFNKDRVFRIVFKREFGGMTAEAKEWEKIKHHFSLINLCRKKKTM